MRQRRQIGKVFRLGLLLVISLTILIAILVFSFGPSFVAKRFNPISPLVLQPLSSASQALHDSLNIVDLHADSLLWGRDLSKLENYGHVDVPRLLQGNVALQVFTVVTKVPTPLLLEGNNDRSDNITKLAILQRWPIRSWFSLKERALYQARRLQSLERETSGKFRMIKTKQDLNDYLAQRQKNREITSGLLGLEGAHALEGQIENVNQFYEAGFRLIGLSHFFDTEVSGSAHGVDKGGLSPFGREVLKRMEALGLIIDLAHASAQTMNEVLQITSHPVLVSHTGVQGTCNNARNLSDRQLQQIAQSGGVIGIGFWETAVCGEDVSAIARAIRYVADKVGIDYVAIGSDFDGAVRVPFDVANLGQLTQALQKEGFSEKEIEKIMSLNVTRLLQKLLPD
ncbi:MULTISPECIES: dipeptidase [Pseudanabaena]|uniref:Membrane dipeptidase n=2 Tax=Pseudanabaena TaxID=1152 RepID=L8N8A0_9CYAN|nr:MULTISPECIES: dipeptidase [Pseudanabaena]ELS34463.1 Membrane dipeptidase [Pseudanabaena biceps PCC 7429]MDG3493331.1 dipeptidase [Pseudanabaena catenata USMAC16]